MEVFQREGIQLNAPSLGIYPLPPHEDPGGISFALQREAGNS